MKGKKMKLPNLTVVVSSPSDSSGAESLRSENLFAPPTDLRPGYSRRGIKNIFLVALLTIIIVIVFNIKFNCNSFACLVFPEKNLWTIKEKYEETKYSWKGLLTHPDYLVRLYKIGNVDTQKATEFTKITTMKIEGLFDKARSPYPGGISDKIVCSDKFIPIAENFKSKADIQINYMSAYLNDRLLYGGCTENQITYKVYSGMFYCSNVSEWYQIEIIVPFKSRSDDDIYRNLFFRVDCQRPSINTGRLFP